MAQNSDMGAVLDDDAKARAAILGAVPLTRMVDYGMDVGSAMRTIEAVTSGETLDLAAERQTEGPLRTLEQLGGPSRLGLLRNVIGSLVVAQLPFNVDTDRKRELIRAIETRVGQLAEQAPDSYSPEVVPFAAHSLHALLVRPVGVIRPPTVILFGGLNGWGVAYLSIADCLAASGLACLLVELPGQGETRINGLDGRDDPVAAVSACVDWILGDDRLGGQVGVWGNSFGGLFSALAAAQDPRISACCISGAPAVPVLPEFRTARELMFAFFGVSDPDAANAELAGLTFTGRAFSQPVLILHGGADPLVARSDQEPFFIAGGTRARWQEWPDGNHTLYNHAVERNAIAADWFCQQLV